MRQYTFVEALVAHAQNKRIKPSGDWTFDNHPIWLGWKLTDCLMWQWNIEEPPTQIPWDCPEDVPMVARFRRKDDPRNVLNFEHMDLTGIMFPDCRPFSWKTIASDYEHTTDNKAWKPCTKEAK